MNQAAISRVFRKFQANEPEPETELAYKNDFELLIAVMLSAQATDVSVNQATPALFAEAPDPASMLRLGEEGIKDRIKTIGLFNSKARNVVKTCEILLARHGGRVPKTREELEALPGVGVKTAGVVMNVAYGAPTLPVDTHVFRVSNRLGLVRTKTEPPTEKALLEVLPRWCLKYAHHWLILHGRRICKARKPDCPRCPVSPECLYPHKTV